MVSFRPFRPWYSLGPRAFRSGTARRLEFSTPNSLSCTSTPPQRLLPLRPASLPASHADHEPLSRGIRSRTLALQHIRTGSPHFSRSLLRTRPAGVTVPAGGPAPRVWLPSRRCPKLPSPWKPISASNARGLRPSKLCSHPAIEPGFPPDLSAPAFPHETSRPRADASAASSRRMSCTPHCGLAV